MHSVPRALASSRHLAGHGTPASVRWFSLRAAYNKKALAENFKPDACQIQCLSRLALVQDALRQAKSAPKARGTPVRQQRSAPPKAKAPAKRGVMSWLSNAFRQQPAASVARGAPARGGTSRFAKVQGAPRQQAPAGAKAKTAPKGVYIYGGPGTGKTMMLDLFHQEVKGMGINCDRQHSHEFLQGVHRRLHALRQRHGSKPFLLQQCAREYQNEFPVVAFDETHVLNVCDAVMLRSFFEAYFDAGGMLVATSNAAPSDLFASGANREVFLPFMDALEEHCDFFQMRGREDYRNRVKVDGSVPGSYLWPTTDLPAGEPCPSQFRPLCLALDLPAGTPAQKPEAVEVDVGFGRKLRCDRAWCLPVPKIETEPQALELEGTAQRRILHFHFDDLCRTATGASEWVALADYADAVILTGVPHFAVHDEDAARRFINLVDVLYDKKRFLAVTAEEEPSRLFSKFVEKYGGDVATAAPAGVPAEQATRSQAATPPPSMEMRVPTHSLGSGRHGVLLRLPQQQRYSTGSAYNGASPVDLSPGESSQEVYDKLLPFRRCASRLTQMCLASQ